MNTRIWLGIDLGDARIGMAASDPGLILAHPLAHIEVYGDSFNGLDDVVDVIREYSAGRVIIGLPLNLDGTHGKSAKKAERWAKALERILAEEADSDVDSAEPVEVFCRDERLTSVSAHDQLLQAGISMRHHKSRVDSQSAVILLQSALDEHASLAHDETQGGDNV